MLPEHVADKVYGKSHHISVATVDTGDEPLRLALDGICAGLIETTDPRSDGQELVQENRCLRTIIAELLMKNQHLRWELQRQQQMMAGA